MLDVFIAGVGMTPFGKDMRPIGVMLADACRMALRDSAPFSSDCVPDCLVIGSMDPIGFARQTGLDSLVGIELGLARDTEIYHVELGSATGASAVELGTRLVSSRRKVLVCFGEKMKGKLRNEDISSQISTVIAEEERERGLGEMPAVAALASYDYMDAYKISEKEFNCEARRVKKLLRLPDSSVGGVRRAVPDSERVLPLGSSFRWPGTTTNCPSLGDFVRGENA